MERPALQKLIADVEHSRVDVIVVYKVDRPTRSLADFAKLVELFDAHSVSFVSVTQSFNTTTSMGRLTLNVLLSFAQFEREVTGDRIRDKIAASKKKGLWMGGVVPLGYRVANPALQLVEEHAELVRAIFRRYLEMCSVVRLKAVLDQDEVRLPICVDGNGKVTGGGLITRGHLHKILTSPIYVGRLSHKGSVYEGQQPAIIDLATWDRVQSLLNSHTQARRRLSQSSESWLAGKLFDDRGFRMSPSAASRGGRRWRYYVSQAVLQGRSQDAGSIPRVTATEIEGRVAEAVRAQDRETREVACDSQIADDKTILALVERVTIGKAGLRVQLSAAASADDPIAQDDNELRTISVAWTTTSTRRRREIILGEGDDLAVTRPMRVEAQRAFAAAYAKAREWLDRLVVDPSFSIASIATSEARTERSIRQTLSLAFLDPSLAKAAMDGRLPRGFGLKRMMDLPAKWEEQWSALGLVR